jgi:hypothetical protein
MEKKKKRTHKHKERVKKYQFRPIYCHICVLRSEEGLFCFHVFIRHIHYQNLLSIFNFTNFCTIKTCRLHENSLLSLEAPAE